MSNIEISSEMVEAGVLALVRHYDPDEDGLGNSRLTVMAILAAALAERPKCWKYGQMTPRPFGDGITYGSDDGKNWVPLSTQPETAQP